MTDTLIDEELLDGTRPSSSGSNSSISRRPMFIEKEARTETSISKRRTGSTTLTNSSRSVYDVLENTKSPTDGLPPTTYTYAHSVSYMPVTESGPYSVPVMARRDLHGEHHSYTSNSSTLSSPTRFMSNVRSQLVNSYSALRDRLTQHDQPAPLLDSPSARYSRSSSNTATSYNRAPVHSTPRPVGDDEEQQKKSQKSKKTTEEEKNQHDDEKSNILVRVLRAPFDLLSAIWHKFFSLPWWLLIPLLLFLGFYAFPQLACRPLEHYPDSKLYKECRHFQEYAHNVTNQTVGYLRDHTYDRGVRNLQGVYRSALDAKDSLVDSLDDVYYQVKKSLRRSAEGAKERVEEAVDTTKENVKGYCDTGLQKMNSLIAEVKSEREKLLGSKHALKPDQEQELQILIRHLLDEYATDETGQADYALEANGAKVVDTRCTEYTDEPRQNVVKFLGIPIVHMSKQPDIMIKAGRLPGQCFPFKGDQGSVVIKLAVPVKPTEFVLEHLSKGISIVGHINSAPNNFTVYALKDKHDKEGRVLGRYFYDAENGPSLQRFKPQLVNVPLVEYIEVRVTSNWGNPNYTCLYRFRVHGDLKTVQPAIPPAA